MPKIGFNDAFDADFSKKVQQLTKDLDALTQQFKSMGKDARDLNRAIGQAKTFQQLTTNTKKATEATTKFANSEKKLIKGIQAVRFEMTAEAKQLAVLNERKRQAKKANTDYARSQVTAAKSTNTFGKAIKSFLFKANFLANVMSNLASTIGRAFIRAVRGAFTVISEFDGAVANLAAISGKTREEIAGLTKQAKALGAVTRFTAAQITNLQIELAKLGFTTVEITASTEAISDFAAATGTELAQSAKIVGVALRVFALGANEAEDAAASLAIATTKSGLTAQQYETILSSVGPVARAYGFELEDITALTGALVTKGFEANKAATATRNIFLKLADAGGALSKEFGNSVTDFESLIKAMARLDDEGVDLGRMLELTDVRSVAAFSALLEGADTVKELRDSISDVNDQLKEMVETQLDSIPGDVDLFKSAWQGLLLTLDSDGPIRFVIQFLTNAILQVSNLTLALKRFSRQSGEEIERSFNLLGALTNKQGEHFDEMIEFFDKMTDEQLLSRGVEQMAKDFALIRKVNQKGGLALANEYLRRREETAASEIQLEEDKLARITADAEKQAKARESIARRAQRAEEEAVEEKRTKAKADARKILNDAYAESQELIAAIKPPEDITAVSTFDVATRTFGMENIEDDLADFSGLIDDLNQSILEDNDELTDALIENVKKRFDFEDQRAKETADREKTLRIDTLQTVGSIAAEGFAVFSGFQQREIQAIETKLRTNELNETISAERKKKIEDKLLVERAKILEKQAKTEKAAAIFSIAINTAVAAIKVAGQTGVGAAIAVPLVLALGAAQLAAVIAEPIPQFEKGVKSSPKGPAIVGEKGPELIIRGGKIGLTPGEPTLMDLKRGTEIVPSDITNELLKYSFIKSAMPEESDNSVFMMMDKLDDIKRAIRSKPVSSSTMTPGGILTATHRGNTTIKKMKKYFM